MKVKTRPVKIKWNDQVDCPHCGSPGAICENPSCPRGTNEKQVEEKDLGAQATNVLKK